MLLTDARRAARTSADGALVPLAEQDRGLWDRCLVAEGVALVTAAMRQGRLGEYQVQAAIAAVHDQAPRHEDTGWHEIVPLYRLLERMTGNPMARLNLAVAVAMLDGPTAGLDLLEGLDERLGDHHRLHSVRAHLYERAGRTDDAIAGFRRAADRSTNLRERHYLLTRAAQLTGRSRPSTS
jgi:predicted RNA polymerase sigma factor